MKSFNDIYSQITTIFNDNSKATTTLAKTLVNDTQRTILADYNWDFTEATATDTTVASQRAYNTPHDYRKLIDVTVTQGGIQYRPERIADRDAWQNLLIENTIVESDYPTVYHIFNDKVEFYPTPSTSGNTITFNYMKRVKDLTFDDDTTGSNAVFTNGDQTVTATSTSWDDTFIGRFIKGADGIWYEIASVTNTTTLELVKEYGSATATSSTITIGAFPIVPEDGHDLLIWRPLAILFEQREDSRASRFWDLYRRGLRDLKKARGSKTTAMSSRSFANLSSIGGSLNPNDFPTGLS